MQMLQVKKLSYCIAATNISLHNFSDCTS